MSLRLPLQGGPNAGNLPLRRLAGIESSVDQVGAELKQTVADLDDPPPVPVADS
jgi:hypothetical protein